MSTTDGKWLQKRHKGGYYGYGIDRNDGGIVCVADCFRNQKAQQRM